ncbi:MAG: SpaA isopeptide-forming pilin-related protein, partial [Eubacterium sp.]
MKDKATASVEFTKKGNGDAPLSGTTFELVRTTDDKAVFGTEVSGADGKVTFNQVDPGEYVVREVFKNTSNDQSETPFGYEKLSGDLMKVTVTKGSPCVVTYEAVDTSTPTHVTVTNNVATVKNNLLRANVKLTKKDQNGDLLPNVYFQLTSNNAADTEDHSRVAELKTNESGVLNIADLSCGTYTLTEETIRGYVSGKIQTPITVAFTITRQDDGTVKVSSNNTDLTLDSDNCYLLGTNGVVENTLKYGTIDVKKVSKDIDNTTQNFGGITFTIYKNMGNSDIYEPGIDPMFMTLTTNDSGGFTQNINGSYPYQGKDKYLVYGDYFIAETGTSGDHEKVSTPYAFTVSDENIGTSSTENKASGKVWLTDAGIVYKKDNTEPQNNTFTNTLNRGAVNLEKTDDKGNTITNAEFVVSLDSDNTNQVASIKYSGSTYQLSPNKVRSTTEQYNQNKKYTGITKPIPYLKQASSSSEYQLLPGTYYVFETGTPENYETPKTYVKKVVIATDGQVTYPTSDNKVTNTIPTASLKITKKDTFKQEGSTGDLLLGITFKLGSKGNLNVTGTNYVTEEKTTGVDGTLTFTGLYPGTYTLTEMTHDGYVDLAPTTYEVVVSSVPPKTGDKTKNVLSVKVKPTGSTGTEAVLTNANGVFNYDITNTPYTGTISLVKKDTYGRLLKGVEFKLYRVITTSLNTTKDYLIDTQNSDESGKVTFANVPYGNYKIVENGTGVTKAKTITVNKSDTTKWALNNSAKTSTYSQGDVTNTLKTKHIQFNKKDQNNDPVNGMIFSVWRSSEKGDLNKFDLTNTETSYQPYYHENGREQYQVTSSAEGLVDLGNLPNGNYKIVEKHQNNIQEGDDVTIIMEVRDDSVQWKYYFGSTESGTLEKATNSGSIYSFNVQNKLKYGFVQMNKTTVEQKSDNTFENGNIKLKNTLFNIYSDTNGNNTLDPAENAIPYLQLKTNANGQFVAEKNGQYKDNLNNETLKYIIYGNYFIQEVSSNQHEAVPAVAFKMAEVGTPSIYAGHEGTAWISYDGTNTSEPAVTYVAKDGKAPEGSHFDNRVIRGSVSIDKVASDNVNTLLSGAKFRIKIAETTQYVGSLKESTTGHYNLSNEVPEGITLVNTNADGLNYLYYNGNEWKLLAGNYVIEEYQAPNGYVKANDVMITIDETGKTTYSSGLINSQLLDKPVTIDLKKMGQSATGTPMVMTDAQFKITSNKNFADKTPGKTGITLNNSAPFWDSNAPKWTIANRLIATPNSAIGDDRYIYTLTEIKAPIGHIPVTGELQFTISQTGVITIIKDDGFKATTKPEVNPKNATDLLTLDNLRVYAHAKLMKYDNSTGNKPIEGAVFKLVKYTGDRANPTRTDIAKSLVTDETGQINTAELTNINAETGKALSDGLTVGTYYFEETSTPVKYVESMQKVYFEIKNTDNGKTIKAGDSIGSTKTGVTNNLLNTKLKLTKYTEGNIKLKNSEFKLEYSADGTDNWIDYKTNTGEFTVLKTDASGLLKDSTQDVSLTQRGTYRLTETKATPGYELKGTDGNAFSCRFTVGNDDADKTLVIVEAGTTG